MRALAYKKFPEREGLIFIPSHLRVVHVFSEPALLDRTAWQNLVFACPNEGPNRVVDIMIMLDMSFTLQVVKADLARLGILTPELRRKCDTHKDKVNAPPGDLLKWSHLMTDSEMAKMHLARALIMNPEVLVLQRPFRRFSEGQGERKRLMEAIHQHISSRGMCLDPSTVGRRRPRTVFFTAETKSQEEEADIIWTVNVDKSISMRLGSAAPALTAKLEEATPSAESTALVSSATNRSNGSFFWPCSSPSKRPTSQIPRPE